MKLEMIDENWRKGMDGDLVPRVRKPPGFVEVRNVAEAEAALAARHRIDSVGLILRYKLRVVRRLLAAAALQGGDQLEQAFYLGVSETCVRKWRKITNKAPALPENNQLDSGGGGQ